MTVLNELRRAYPYGVLDQRCTDSLEIKVLSSAFNVHIQGQAGGQMGWPYAWDGVVRKNGVESSLVIPIRPKLNKIDAANFTQITSQLGNNAFSVMKKLAKRGLDSLSDFEVIFVKMLRPMAPNCLQWGIPGGVKDQDETSQDTADRESNEETTFQFAAKSRLLCNQLYQSGNTMEWHHIYFGVGYGYYELTEEAHNQGQKTVEFFNLATALQKLNVLSQVPIDSPQCILPDAKADHGLRTLISALNTLGIS